MQSHQKEYSEPCKTSKMENLAKMSTNSQKLRPRDVWQSSEYTTVDPIPTYLSITTAGPSGGKILLSR